MPGDVCDTWHKWIACSWVHSLKPGAASHKAMENHHCTVYTAKTSRITNQRICLISVLLHWRVNHKLLKVRHWLSRSSENVFAEMPFNTVSILTAIHVGIFSSIGTEVIHFELFCHTHMCDIRDSVSQVFTQHYVVEQKPNNLSCRATAASTKTYGKQFEERRGCFMHFSSQLWKSKLLNSISGFFMWLSWCWKLLRKVSEEWAACICRKSRWADASRGVRQIWETESLQLLTGRDLCAIRLMEKKEMVWRDEGRSVRYVFVSEEMPDTAASSSRIQSLPGKRILWRTISAIMQPTAQISTTYVQHKRREKRISKKKKQQVSRKIKGSMFLVKRTKDERVLKDNFRILQPRPGFPIFLH